MLTDSLFHWNFKFILISELCNNKTMSGFSPTRFGFINLLGLNNLLNCGSDCLLLILNFFENLGIKQL
jgi:hypothetical protein